jgi:quinol monooxygenase YgiN
MAIVQIEHAVRDFDAWKAAFDSGPASREESGVQRYRILRPLDDPHYIMVELEFEDTHQAESFIAAMQEVWDSLDYRVIESPRARIVHAVETREY